MIHYRKTSGPEGYELQLINIPNAISMVDFISVYASLIITRHTRPSRHGPDLEALYNDPSAWGHYDVSLLFRTIDDLETTVAAMSNAQFALLEKASADAIISAPFDESAFRLKPHPDGIITQTIKHDMNGFALGESVTER